MKTFLKLSAASVCCLALASCGGGDSSEDTAPVQPEQAAPSGGERASGGGGNPLVGQNASTFSTGMEDAPDAAVGEESQDTAGEAVAVSTETAEGAVNSYLDLLIVGNFRGAADVCVDSAEGTAELRRLADNLDNMAEETGEEMRDVVVGRMGADFKKIEWKELSNDGELAVFEMVRPDSGTPMPNMEVRKVGDEWRVVPPAKGTPL